MTEPMIGGLDLAPKNIGWACGAGVIEPLSLPRLCIGTVPTPHPKFISGQKSFIQHKCGNDFGRLLWKFEEWLIAWITGNRLAHLFVEAPKYKFRDREDARGALQMAGIVDKVCAQLGIDCQEVEIFDLKIFVADQGNCDKQPMMKSALAMGWEFASSDECDGQWLLAYGREVIREIRHGNLAEEVA